MVTYSKPFPWPRRSREAAAMFARGDAWAVIEGTVGVTNRTLQRWHAHPDFAAEVGRLKSEIAEAVKLEGVVNRQNRLDAYNERWRLMQQVIQERAEDKTMDTVPGAGTGLLVRTYKLLGSGPDSTLVPEYAVDTGLLKELRAHEEQAAKDAGQWSEKRDVSGEMLVRQYVGVPVEQV